MSDINDGGPAFQITKPLFMYHEGDPGSIVKASETLFQGMSLRDYFAAAALQACMGQNSPPDMAARDAYTYADAMLKARKA